MKIVIEISEEDYKLIKSYGKGSTNYRITLNLYDAVKNGTPLPEGHGRLKDIDELYNQRIEQWNPFIQINEYEYVTTEAIERYAPTIIEADRSDRNGEND